MSTHTEVDMAVHHRIIRSFLEQGRPPTNTQLAETLAISLDELETSLRRLERAHAVVLHPDRPEPWVVHPFSASPTHTWIEVGERGWWAPCLWCALGISTLAGGEGVIHTRIGGEAEDVDIAVRDGFVGNSELYVHFPEPPRLAWNNVHHFCARLLPFRAPADVDGWCARHGLPVGWVLPIDQLAHLARLWYGRHADENWQKWTVSEAAAIFERVELVDDFWQLEVKEETF